MHVSIFFRKIYKFRVLTTTHNNESFICSVYFNGVATSPFVAFSVTEQYRARSRSDNAWFNCTCYHLPQATPGKRLHLQARGWGITSNCLVPGVRGRGNLKPKVSTRRPCEARHFSDRVENYFQGKCPEFVADWLELSNLSRKKKMAYPRGYARRGW